MKGLTNITYIIDEDRYNQIVCKINDKNIYIPVVGDVNPKSTEQMINIINDVILRELKLCE